MAQRPATVQLRCSQLLFGTRSGLHRRCGLRTSDAGSCFVSSRCVVLQSSPVDVIFRDFATVMMSEIGQNVPSFNAASVECVCKVGKEGCFEMIKGSKAGVVPLAGKVLPNKGQGISNSPCATPPSRGSCCGTANKGPCHELACDGYRRFDESYSLSSLCFFLSKQRPDVNIT